MTRTLPVGRWWCTACLRWVRPDHAFTQHQEHYLLDCPSCGEVRGIERTLTPDGWLHRPCASCGAVHTL